MARSGLRLPVAEVALVGMAAVWGLTFVMVQDAIRFLPVMAFLAYRFIPAALLVAVVFRRELVALGREGLRAGLLMGAALIGGYVFQTFGLAHTSAANAGFITGLWVVLTPVLGALLFSVRVGLPAWGAAFVSAVGLLLLSGFGGQGASVAGDALVFLCAVSFTLHIFATDRAVKEHSVGGLLVVQLAVVGVFSLAVAAAAGDLQMPRQTEVWTALVVTAVIASALGFFVQTYAQRRASPVRVALILASEPAFAGLFAYLLAGERLTGAGWLGAGLILGAIVTVEVLPHLVRRYEPVPQLEEPLPEFD